MAAYMRDWQQEHRERRADYKKQYRKENHAKVLAGKQRYNAEHPEKKIQSDHKRRSKVRGAGGEYTEDDLAILYVVQEGRCCWCGREIVNRLIDKEAPRKSKFTVDRINPIARGGSNWAWNIALACAHCNTSRSKRQVFAEWYPPAMLDWMLPYVLRGIVLDIFWAELRLRMRWMIR